MGNQEREAAWREWLAERPEAVRLVAEHFPPWVPLRIKSTGQKAHLYLFGEKEDGSVCLQVHVRADENPDSLHSIMLPDGHMVFGLAPNDVEPWAVSASRPQGESPQ